MDKQTLSNYGWIVVAILIISVMLAMATPFGVFVAEGVSSAYTGFISTNDAGNNMLGILSGRIYSPKDNLAIGKFYEYKGGNNYTVSIEIPYVPNEGQHDEVIVMVDGSSSVDTEWPAIRESIMKIGQAFLNGKGNTQLTLMAFGISPNVVDDHIASIEELENLLNQYQGNLLYGRSATNCAGAFEGINDYINSHNGMLENAYVIYITDGGVNFNNTKINWRDSATSYVKTSDATNAVAENFLRIADGVAQLSKADEEIFGEDVETMITEAKNYLETGNSTHLNNLKSYANQTLNGTTKGKAWVIANIEDIFEYAKLDMDEAYPAHIVEKATIDYKNANFLGIEEVFYYAAARTKALSNGTTNQNATVAVGTETAKLVDHLYLVQYGSDSRAKWMKNIAEENVTYTNAGAITNVENIIEEVVDAVTKTQFEDMVITDFVNKHLTLDPQSIKVTDVNGKVIAQLDEENSTKDLLGNYTKIVFKWTDEALCSDVAPIILELMTDAECQEMGKDFIGNTSGEVYKIIWNVKDGVIMRNELYRLTYNVTVDLDEGK